jgi:hypothetical protein
MHVGHRTCISKALLFSRAFAVGAFRTFLKTICAFGKVRTFLRLDLLLIRCCALSQSARGLLAFFCWSLFDTHRILLAYFAELNGWTVPSFRHLSSAAGVFCGVPAVMLTSHPLFVRLLLHKRHRPPPQRDHKCLPQPPCPCRGSLPSCPRYCP